MTEIDLDSTFDVRLMAASRTRNLEPQMRECEKNVLSKLRGFAYVAEKDEKTLDSIVKNFIGVALSVSQEVETREIFLRDKKNGYFELIRLYSIYSASKAVLNSLRDPKLDMLLAEEEVSQRSYVSGSDLEGGADSIVLEQILAKFCKMPATSSPLSLKYAYFSFFNCVREVAKRKLRDRASGDTITELNQVKIKKTGLAFNEINIAKRKRMLDNEKARALSASADALPNDLPIYEPNSSHTLDRVIGNTQAVELLRAAMIRLVKYDPTRKKNPFFPFRDAFLVYGIPGTGKNTTVDALLNHFRTSGSKYGEGGKYVRLSEGLRSSYKDKSAQVLEHYLRMERDGDRAYVNIIDEADSIFPTSANGEMNDETKKLIGELKSAINNSDKGNSIYIVMTNYSESFESALSQRFTPVEVAGPSTGSEFAKLIAIELGRNGLTTDDLAAAGQRVYELKMMYQPKNASWFGGTKKAEVAPITGRDIKKIVAPYVSGNDALVVANEDTIRRATYEETEKLIPSLRTKINLDQMMQRIDTYVRDLVSSRQETTARYNSNSH